MADPIYTSASPIAVNPADGSLIGGATFTVHAPDDTSFSTPLTVTDPVSGAAINPLRSNSNGTLPAFKVAGDLPRVRIKSGGFVTELVSLDGLVSQRVSELGPSGLPDPTGLPDGYVAVVSGGAWASALPIGLPNAEALPNGSVPVVQNSVWTTVVGGAGGTDREIQMQATGTYIQWRYVGDAAWTNLVALSALKGTDGAPGAPGAPGSAVQMRVSGGYFQYKLATDSTWTNLIAIADLGATASGPGANVVAHKVVAAANATTAQKAVADYVCDGVNDETEINAAIADVAALYGAMSNSNGNAGVVQLVGTNFVIGNGCTTNAGSIKMRQNVTLRGSGMFKTWIKAHSSFVTYTPSLTPDANPASGTGTAISNTAAGMIELFDNNVQYANIEDLLLFANAGGGARVMGIKQVWTDGGTITYLHSDKGCHTSRVMIQQPASHGVANYGGGSTAPNRAVQYEDIRVMDAGGTVDANACGYYTTGADHVWNRCTSGSAAAHGWFIGGSNNHFTDCTSWFGGSLASTANGSTSSANGCGFWINGARCTFTGVTAQDNFGHGFIIRNGQNIFSSVIADSNGYSRTEGTASGSGFYIVAGNNVIQGVAFDKAEGDRVVYQDYGVRFGDSTLQGLIIDVATNNNRLGSVGGSIPKQNNRITILDRGNAFSGGIVGKSIAWDEFRQVTMAPNTAPTDSDLAEGQVSIWQDDVAGALKARVRKADGSYRTVNLEGGGSADLSSVVPKDVTLTVTPTSSQFKRTLSYAVGTSDPDLFSIVIGSTQKMWLNEWGALRGTSPYTWGDSLVRGIRSDGDGITTGDFIQLNDRRTGAASTVPFAVKWVDGSIARNGVTMQMVYTLNAGQTAADIPAGVPAGSLILRRTT